MVVKIMKSAGSMKGPLDYNRRKVLEGGAEVLSVVNMGKEDVAETFQRYENANFRSQEVSFHMSFNPGPGEDMDDEKVKECIGELMEGLGYGAQPYVIYRHTDIEREHFHVVSIRTDSSGRKIRDFYEKRNCLKILNELSEKYGFKVGTDAVMSASLEDGPLFRYKPTGADTIWQMATLASRCCQYRFTSDTQFRILMKQCGIKVSENPSDPSMMVFRGMDARGKTCTGPVTESALKMDVGKSVSDRIWECLHSEEDLSDERMRVARDWEACLTSSSSERAFRQQLASCGLSCAFARDSSRRIWDACIVDSVSRSVFSLGELHGVDLMELRQVDDAVWSRQSETESVSDTIAEALSSVGRGRSMEHDMKDRPEERRARKRGMRR